MELLQAHHRAMTEFDARVRAVGDDQWGASTPCTDWSVHDLVNHLVNEQLWTPELLAGARLEDVGDRFDGDQLGDDPVLSWDAAAGAARTAWLKQGATTGEVFVTGGVIPAEDYGWQMTMDLTVHAWDLARGIDADDTLDPDLVEVVHQVFAPQIPAMQGIGIFAAPISVSDDADLQTQLLALLGRQR